MARSTTSDAAMAQTAGTAGRSKAKASRLALIIVLVVLPLGLLALPTTILLLFGLVPTMVALIVDRAPEKYAALTVGSLNLAGVLPALLELWISGHTVAVALDIIGAPMTWLIAYSAAAVGWLIYFSLPPLFASFMALRYQGEIKAMKARQVELIQEWGPEVAGDAAPAEADDANA